MHSAKVAPRADGFPLWVPWLLGSILALAFFGRDYLHENGGLIDHATFWGRDFVNVWTGGHLVREGRLDLLYDLSAYSEYQRSLFPGIGPHNYSYPPVTYPIAAAFSMLPYGLALAGWLIGTGWLFIQAARPFWPERAGPAWLAVLTPAAVLNIWAGHYAFLIGALFLFGWQRLDKKPVQAGIFFGAMLIKPHIAALVPLALLIRRDWTAFASAAATVMLLVLSTSAIYGWACWHDFLFRTTGVQTGMIDAGDAFFGLMSTSAATAMLRIGADMPVAILVQGLFSFAAVALVAIAAARGARTADLALLTATATFLLLPYAFNYDLTVVMIAALAVLTAQDVSPGERRLGVYGLLSPQLGLVLSAVYLPLMPVMLLGLAIVQFRRAMRHARAPRSPVQPVAPVATALS